MVTKVLRRRTRLLMMLRLMATSLSVAIFMSSQAAGASPIYTASYYTLKSCLREGTSGIMANGRKLDDNAFTCASWDHKFGTKLRITNIQNGKSVIVAVTDRGPAKRLYRKGRIIDLSKAEFKSIGETKKGIIEIKVEKLEEGKWIIKN